MLTCSSLAHQFGGVPTFTLAHVVCGGHAGAKKRVPAAFSAAVPAASGEVAREQAATVSEIGWSSSSAGATITFGNGGTINRPPEPEAASADFENPTSIA